MTIIVGIILYHSDLPLLSKSLHLFMRQTWHKIQPDSSIRFLLLDNADGAQGEAVMQLLQENQLPSGQITYIASENIGFGAGHNFLFKKAAELFPEFNYYLCVNPDGIPHPGMIENLVTFAQKHQDKGIFEASQFPVQHPKVFDPKTGETEWASGCCVLYPRPVFEAVEGFDDSFFMYMEDVDLSWRARLKGYPCYSVSNALFSHYVYDKRRDAAREALNVLKSGYKLAYKYQHSDFETWVLSQLSAQITADELILLKAQAAEQIKERLLYTDCPMIRFEPYFSFSEVRW